MKRTLVLIIAVLAVCTAAIYAAVAGAAAKPVLSFDGRTALCRFSLSASGDPLKAVLELRCGEMLIKSWEADGEGYLLMEGTARVTPGETYELSAGGNIGGKAFKTVTVSAVCPAGSGNAPVFLDPQQRDWEKISAVAKALLELDERGYCSALEYMGLVLPQGYQEDTEQAAKVITHLLQNAAEGNWGAYDYTELAELQERVLDVLENQKSFAGEGAYEDKGGSEDPSSDADLAADAPGFVWPLDEITISAEFGPFWYSTEEMPALHTGLDLKSDKGEEIHAAQAGTVVFAGWDGSYGYRVAVSHGAGLETWYAHCSELLVEEGDAVEQGQTIALVGVTGYSTGPHLHFEVRLDGESVDPMDYLEGDGRIGANTGKAAFQEYPGLEKMDFEKSTQGLLASGLDAEYVQWTPDEDRIGGGWLYFVNPRFAHPYFEGATVEGSAQWEPGPYSFSKYTMLSFDLTKCSVPARASTGPTLGCLVDLAGNRIVSKSGVPWDGEEIELTDEDILQIAAYFSFVLKGAQDAWSELAEQPDEMN